MGGGGLSLQSIPINFLVLIVTPTPPSPLSSLTQVGMMKMIVFVLLPKKMCENFVFAKLERKYERPFSRKIKFSKIFEKFLSSLQH